MATDRLGGLFMAINGWHVWRLWLERRPVELSADEAKLYDLTFFPLTRRRFVELARLGRWADLEAGDVLARPGQPVEEVVVPLTDGIEARIGERVLGRFAAGEIVGAAAVYGRPQQFEAVAGESCASCGYPSPRSSGTPSRTISSPGRSSGSRARTSPASSSAWSAKPRPSPRRPPPRASRPRGCRDVQ